MRPSRRYQLDFSWPNRNPFITVALQASIPTDSGAKHERRRNGHRAPEQCPPERSNSHQPVVSSFQDALDYLGGLENE